MKTLADNLVQAGTTLYTAQEGMDTSLQAFDGSFQALGAQGQLNATWSAYLRSLQGKCAAVATHLTDAGAALCITDAGAKGIFDELNSQFKDTPAVGGQS